MFKKAFYINKAPKEFQRLITLFVLCCLGFNLFILSIITFFDQPQHRVLVLKAPGTVDKEVALKMYNVLKLTEEILTIDEHLTMLKDDSLYLKACYKYFKELPDRDKAEVKPAYNYYGSLFSGYDSFKQSHGLPYRKYENKADLNSIFWAIFLLIINPIIAIAIFNFTLSPIAEKHKNFWIVPYLLSLIILVGNGILIISSF